MSPAGRLRNAAFLMMRPDIPGSGSMRWVLGVTMAAVGLTGGAGGRGRRRGRRAGGRRSGDGAGGGAGDAVAPAGQLGLEVEGAIIAPSRVSCSQSSAGT